MSSFLKSCCVTWKTPHALATPDWSTNLKTVNMWLKWTLFFYFVYVTYCDDGLCGLEPPKEGESCSGSKEETEEPKVLQYEYEEKPITEEEKEVWAKRFYNKLR